jgi:imidazolonepropionase
LIADLLIHNTSEVLTCAGPAPRRGAAQGDVSPVAHGVVASSEGTIVYVGDEEGWGRVGSLAPGASSIDARGGTVVPGFVDAHTHVVFAGDRHAELRRRLAGDSYAAIAAAGGGIVSTVAATRAAPEEELAADTARRLDDMLRCGTTMCEAKSGYGLTTESELKMLRVIARLEREHAVELSSTFLGAHLVPPEYQTRRPAYLELLRREMIPAVAAARLAEWCDVFCETGVFSPAESRAVLADARHAGMKLRIHADELGPSGGSEVAADLRVQSADHLVYVDDSAARALSAAGVVATLLPSASFYLKLGRFAPARMLIGHDVPVALATDVNPGGGLSPSMPFAMTLACFGMGLTFEEALVGATINGACSIDRQDRAGSLEAGKQMDAVIVDGPAIELIRVGARTIREVVKKGRLVYG